jgi:hypothetical protein
MLYYESIVSEERYTGKPHFGITDHSSPACNFRKSCTKYRVETARDCSIFVVVTQPRAAMTDCVGRSACRRSSVQTAVPTELGAGAGDTATLSPNTTLGS